jgi:hypothetical protein
MFGPGEYVPDPTEGIVDVKDLPTPQLVTYHRNHHHTPCPRCGHLAYRHKSDQRTLHDLGDLYIGCPVDLLVTDSASNFMGSTQERVERHCHVISYHCHSVSQRSWKAPGPNLSSVPL